MPNIDPATGMAHYDLKNPDDLAALIANGLIWKGDQRSWQIAIQAIVDGDVPRPTANVPPEVNSFLDQHMPAQPGEPR